MKRLCYLAATAIAVLLVVVPPVQAGKCCDAKPAPKAVPSGTVSSAPKDGHKVAKAPKAGQASTPSKAKATKTSGKLAKKEVKALALQN
ncbi:MAG: hypothetical protein AAB676_16215 [Verrucomicrobiota bacterium]